jgi:hypothetical protein
MDNATILSSLTWAKEMGFRWAIQIDSPNRNILIPMPHHFWYVMDADLKKTIDKIQHPGKYGRKPTEIVVAVYDLSKDFEHEIHHPHWKKP